MHRLHRCDRLHRYDGAAIATLGVPLVPEHLGMIRVRCCSGHTGIEGKELADQLAQEWANMSVGDNPPTVSCCKRQMRSLLPIVSQWWWDTVDCENYHGLQSKASPQTGTCPFVLFCPCLASAVLRRVSGVV